MLTTNSLSPCLLELRKKATKDDFLVLGNRIEFVFLQVKLYFTELFFPDLIAFPPKKKTESMVQPEKL